MSDEVARPEKDNRHPYEKLARKDLVFFKVTETNWHRERGLSPVQELLDQGWIKPNDPKLLRASPSGLSFYLVKPRTLVEEGRARRRKLAKSQEGFKAHPAIKAQHKDETEYKGKEITDQIDSYAGRPGKSSHDG